MKAGDNFQPLPTERYGLQVNYDPVSSTTSARVAVADLVFVHGIGSSARGAWTHRVSEAFWPEWLPKEDGLENVRISTFGYIADWANLFKVQNILGIAGFARQLLAAVENHYVETTKVRCLSFPTCAHGY